MDTTFTLRRSLAALVLAIVLPCVALADGDGRFFPTGDDRIDAIRRDALRRKTDMRNAIQRADAIVAWGRLLVARCLSPFLPVSAPQGASGKT